MSLLKFIKAEILRHGPMGIDDYMALCLSHPEHGYYMKQDPFGTGGDFITAPEISQIFGELIGAWIAHQWQLQGSPRAILTELGPGRGTLMLDALRATKNIPGFHAAISIHLVETSPVLRQIQRKLLQDYNVEWHDDISTLLPKAGHDTEQAVFTIANEFFDALPIKQYVWRDNAWQERLIQLHNNGLAFSSSPTFQNQCMERCAASIDIVTNLATSIKQHGGSAIIVDYGYMQGHGDTLQAMRGHAYANPLEEAGHADITAHVDFRALKMAADHAGVTTFISPQGEWLLKMGAALRLSALISKATAEQKAVMVAGVERLTAPEQMGELFKVMTLTPA